MRAAGAILRSVAILIALACLGCGGGAEFNGPKLPPGESPTEKAIKQANEAPKAKVGGMPRAAVFSSPDKDRRPFLEPRQRRGFRVPCRHLREEAEARPPSGLGRLGGYPRSLLVVGPSP